jgi:hypothetical protein
VVTTYAGGQLAALEMPAHLRAIAACRSAARAATIAAADWLLPSALMAQAYQYTGSDCWKFQRVGFTEVHSVGASENSECGNYALNSALQLGGTAALGIIGNGFSDAPALLAKGKPLHVAINRVIVASPAALGLAAGAIAGAFVGSAAGGYFVCSRHRVGERERCRSNLPSGGASAYSPVPGPMGWATGLSTAYVRGTNDRFWGIPARTN